MIQTQWPGLGSWSSLTPGITGQGWSGAGSVAPPQSADGVSPSWWSNGANTGTGTNGSANPSGMGSMLQSIFQLLVGLLGSVLGSGFGQNGFGQGGFGSGCLPGAGQQFSDVDISSTGDPHIAETGTALTPNGAQAVDQHYDSMTSHDDLVRTGAVAGGYRVSTAVTAPAANGVTFNDSATVHANFEQDAVTMNRDGTFAISDSGNAVALAKGQSVTLSGGETVSENQDGSLVVSAANGQGGTISTTLHGTGSGVDVTTHAHQLAVGGDVVEHAQHAQHARHPRHQPVTNAP